MKKTILLILSIAFAGTMFSQKGFTFGPLIGFNSSKFTTNIPDLAEEAQANFLGGAFVRFGKKLYVQPEVVWATKGGILTDDKLPGAETTIKLKQVEIPLMLGLKIINLEVVNIRLMLGPMAGIVTDKEVTVTDLVADPIPETSLQDLQWAMHFGAGVDVLFLTLDVRYELGLNNLYETPSGGEVYDMKNNLWRVSLGWKIL